MTAVMAMLVIASTLLLIVGLINLRWILDAWWTPTNHAVRAALPPEPQTGAKVSLLVPARHEVEVLAATLERIADQRYGDFEVIVVVGHDDPDTAAVARECAERLGERFQVVVDSNPVKNKPLALNVGLAAATGDLVGVFDAEDDVHPDLVRHIVAAFSDPSVGVVQGPVQLMNHDSTWFTVHNVLEYFFYFGSRLHHHARAGFIPLGGNTVFIRRHLLAGGAWDSDNLTEDCELGVRLSSAGEQVRVLYRPDIATREEAPVSLGDFVRQRSRWNQGFLQTYRKGVWRGLPFRQRALARLILMMPMLQAATFLVMPLTVLVGVLADFPLIVGLYTYLPLAVLIATAVVHVVGLREFGLLYNRRVTWWDQVVMVAGIVPYSLVLMYAAFRAVIREGRGDRRWEKTAHVDAHRVVDPQGALLS
jgi:cellulose synthase/poly-beta-1,6-N-acetylglucosamine synthase-like glycosyltransferase